jgi:hypothetical protein
MPGNDPAVTEVSSSRSALTLACEPGDSPPQNPAHDREDDADEDAGSERKVESEVAFPNCDVSRQMSQPAEPGRKFPKQYANRH